MISTLVDHLKFDNSSEYCGDGLCHNLEDCVNCPEDVKYSFITSAGLAQDAEMEIVMEKKHVIHAHRTAEHVLLFYQKLGSLCETNNGGCDINAECHVLADNRVQCTCNPGFTGNGLICKEIISDTRIDILSNL